MRGLRPAAADASFSAGINARKTSLSTGFDGWCNAVSHALLVRLISAAENKQDDGYDYIHGGN